MYFAVGLYSSMYLLLFLLSNEKYIFSKKWGGQSHPRPSSLVAAIQALKKNDQIQNVIYPYLTSRSHQVRTIKL